MAITEEILDESARVLSTKFRVRLHIYQTLKRCWLLPNDKRTADQIAMNLRDRPKEDMSIYYLPRSGSGEDVLDSNDVNVGGAGMVNVI